MISAETLGVRFLDTPSAFLVERFAEENEQRPEMRRDGTTFVPRARGSSESISRAGGAAGLLQEGQKQ